MKSISCCSISVFVFLIVSAPSSEEESFPEVRLKLGKKFCVCSIIFKIKDNKVLKSSKVTCDKKCSGTGKNLVLTSNTTRTEFSFGIKVKKGKASLIKPSVEVHTALGLPEDGYFEGDIKLNGDQLLMLQDSVLESEGSSGSLPNVLASEPSGAAIIGDQYRWPENRLRFQIGSSVPYYDASFIRSTVANLERKLDSCIKFEEVSSGNRVLVNNYGGCSSMVGYQNWPTQDMSLQTVACIYMGTIEHEFLHALGVWHHQSRPDRDSYIRILWQNIPSNLQSNFAKYSSSAVNTYGIPYDYTSVMHYGGWAFGSGRMTIQTLDPNMQNVIGHSQFNDGISNSDIELVKKMYGCEAKTSSTSTPKPASTSDSGTTTKPAVCKEDKYSICSNFQEKGLCTGEGDTEILDWMEDNCYKSCIGCPEGYGGPDDWGYCTGSCTLGQGDCDSDTDCSGELVCGQDNCRQFHSQAMETADCCMESDGEENHCPYTDQNTYCKDWANLGYCSYYYVDYMTTYCQKSCWCTQS